MAVLITRNELENYFSGNKREKTVAEEVQVWMKDKENNGWNGFTVDGARKELGGGSGGDLNAVEEANRELREMEAKQPGTALVDYVGPPDGWTKYDAPISGVSMKEAKQQMEVNMKKAKDAWQKDLDREIWGEGPNDPVFSEPSAQGPISKISYQREDGTWGDLSEFDNPKRNGHPRFYEILDELADLHSRKNADYATGGPALGNFYRRAELYSRYPGLDLTNPAVVALVDAMKQLDAALWFYSNKHEAAVEGKIDRLRDVAVYAVLASIMEEENNGKYWDHEKPREKTK